jgi:hypothetical protein
LHIYFQMIRGNRDEEGALLPASAPWDETFSSLGLICATVCRGADDACAMQEIFADVEAISRLEVRKWVITVRSGERAHIGG